MAMTGRGCLKTLVSFAQFSVFHRLGLVRNIEIRDRGNFPAQLHEFRLTAPAPIGFSHSLGQRKAYHTMSNVRTIWRSQLVSATRTIL